MRNVKSYVIAALLLMMGAANLHAQSDKPKFSVNVTAGDNTKYLPIKDSQQDSVWHVINGTPVVVEFIQPEGFKFQSNKFKYYKVTTEEGTPEGITDGKDPITISEEQTIK